MRTGETSGIFGELMGLCRDGDFAVTMTSAMMGNHVRVHVGIDG